MTLSAHTQEVGFHKQNQTLMEYYAFADGRTDYYPFTRENDLSVKPAATKGDHKSPTRYRRTVSRIVDDQPLRWEILTTRNHRDYITDYVVHAYRSHGWVLNNKFKNIDGIIANARNRANVRALNDLGGEKQQLLVDLAESRQTFQMLYGAASAMYGALRNMRRGNPVGALRALGITGRGALTGKTLANGYLQWRYGWAPLMGTIYGLQEALKKNWEVSVPLKGKGFSPISFSQESTYGSVTEAHSASGGCKVVYHAKIKNTDMAIAKSLGIGNPASLLWELVPYSFVVDWFIPIGSVLEAYTATQGLSDVYGYSSTWVDRSYTYSEVHESVPKSRIVISNPRTTEKGYTFDRDVFLGAQTPQFYGEPSPFGGGKSSRGFALAALIRQLAK